MTADSNRSQASGSTSTDSASWRFTRFLEGFDMTKDKTSFLSTRSDNHFQVIGMILVLWSYIEMAMECAICRLYDINMDRGLVLTSNIGFQSRVSLLRILAKRGAIEDAEAAKECLSLLSRIEKGYADRNAVAHALWSGTDDPAVAQRMAIRAKGSRLRCIQEPVHLSELADTLARLDTIRREFAALMRRLGLEGPMGE